MKHRERCSVAYGYAVQLRQMLEDPSIKELYEADAERLDGIMVDDGAMLSNYTATCLRGFACIDWMCEAVNGCEWPGDPEPVKMELRSWEGLSALKKELEARNNELEMDRVELQIGGVLSQKFGQFKSQLREDQVATVLTLEKRSSILTNTVIAIKAMRPYLQNPTRSLVPVGTALYLVNRDIGTPFNEMVDKLEALTTVKP